MIRCISIFAITSAAKAPILALPDDRIHETLRAAAVVHDDAVVAHLVITLTVWPLPQAPFNVARSVFFLGAFNILAFRRINSSLVISAIVLSRGHSGLLLPLLWGCMAVVRRAALLLLCPLVRRLIARIDAFAVLLSQLCISFPLRFRTGVNFALLSLFCR